jgi:threonine synthase
VYKNYHYLLDPHGAVGFRALDQYLQSYPDQKGIVLETAHPVKFYDAVEPVIGQSVPIPATIQHQLTLEKNSIKMEANSESLKSFLLQLSET